MLQLPILDVAANTTSRSCQSLHGGIGKGVLQMKMQSTVEISLSLEVGPLGFTKHKCHHAHCNSVATIEEIISG